MPSNPIDLPPSDPTWISEGTQTIWLYSQVSYLCPCKWIFWPHWWRRSPDLEDEMDHSTTTQKNPRGCETDEFLMDAPGDKNADMDHFQDHERQEAIRGKIDKELQTAPWTQQTSEQTLGKLENIVDTVNPVYEGFWEAKWCYHFCTNQNLAAQKMKNRTDAKKDTPHETYCLGTNTHKMFCCCMLLVQPLL